MSGEHILVIDDEPDIRNLVREILIDEEFDVSIAEDAADARNQRQLQRPDLILLDIWMPGTDGITLLKEWKQEDMLQCPVIMMSGHGTVETAVEATRLGAYDFIEKPLSIAKLLLTINRALEASHLAQENIGLRKKLPIHSEPAGTSKLIRELKDQCARIAKHDAPVLLTGEQGCGKQTIARYLHLLSDRSQRPFVELALTSASGETASRELLGSEQGGQLQYGLLEQAHGGILYIEELSDLDLDIQAQLLSALDSEKFLRIGGAQPVQINVRIIAATHKDLEAEVQAGRLREDLYYRLNVVPLHVPPLREHSEDIPELLETNIELFNTQYGLPYRHFPVEAQNFLRNYAWPGNIRELQNLVQRLMILGNDTEITLQEVQSALGAAAPQAEAVGSAHMASDWLDLPLREAREAFERYYLQHRLKEVNGNMSHLAKNVGMERTHLYRKLRALEIDPKQLDET